MTTLIQPIVQDLDSVVFCKMLSKADRLVSPESHTAIQIFNHWRAYTQFPGTSFADNYFQCEIKIVECDFEQDFQLVANFPTYGNWLIDKSSKVQKVFLKCADETYLQVNRICLNSGKQIELKNFEF